VVRVALQNVERRERDGGEEVRHSVIETEAAVEAWGKSWEEKAVAHRARDTAQVGVRDSDNTGPEDGRRYKMHRSDRRGSICKG
jgi:heme-degrading monooxygenase HmoA